MRSWIDFRSSRIWAWMVTSRAVVGSSAISSFGSHDRPIAIITRWRMPPDISCGYCLTRRSGLGMPTRVSASIARSQASFFETFMCSWTCSAIWSPMVKTGFRLVSGSWKIIAMSLPRILRISSIGMDRISRPSNQISPEVISAGGMSSSRMIVRAVTLLPLPDSPTMPRVLPRPSEKETPSTAGTSPSITWKTVRRFRTSSRMSLGGGAPRTLGATGAASITSTGAVAMGAGSVMPGTADRRRRAGRRR